MTVEQAAAWIGVSRRTMDNLRAAGRLDGAYFQVGAVVRYHRDTMRTVMLATSAPATPAAPTELSSVQVAQVLALLAAHRAQAAAPPPPPPPDVPTSTPDDPTGPRRRRESPGLAALRAGILPPRK